MSKNCTTRLSEPSGGILVIMADLKDKKIVHNRGHNLVWHIYSTKCYCASYIDLVSTKAKA
jgi:hypothetical protein